MSVLCVIPARGGSKGIPRKNLRRVGGSTLIERAVEASLASAAVDAVVVSTDDDEIEVAARRGGAEVIRRPSELGTDSASSESALLHALAAYRSGSGIDPEVLVFVQCTSPLIDPADIERAVAMVVAGGFDCVFSAVPSHAFLWREVEGEVVGVNHDGHERKRRQDMPTEYRETGAIYVMRVAGFLEHKHRFFGRVGVCQVAARGAIDIDSEDDLELAELLVEGRRAGRLDRLDPARVVALVTDFDGVHTNNLALVDDHGGEAVVVNRSDGLGLSALRGSGLPMLILSTEQHPVVTARANKLQIECVQGVDDKVSVLRAWADRLNIHPSGIVYVGNDANDRSCLEAVGWPIAVADAHPSAIITGAMVTQRPGGAGALREIADRLLAGSGPRGWQQVVE